MCIIAESKTELLCKLAVGALGCFKVCASVGQASILVPVYMKTGGIVRHHLALACVFVFIFSNYAKALKSQSLVPVDVLKLKIFWWFWPSKMCDCRYSSTITRRSMITNGRHLQMKNGSLK